MRVDGVLTREGKFWLAEIPILHALTQGRSRKEALAMVADWVRTISNRPRLDFQIHDRGADRFELDCDPAVLVALMLRRRREASGLTLAEVSRRLGSRSRNTYARYEQGTAVPSVAKLDQLMQAVGGELVIRDSSPGYDAVPRRPRRRVK